MDTIRKMFENVVSIGSYKIQIMHLAGIVFLIWIIFGHALCSCCKVNIFEGFKEGMDEMIDETKKEEEQKKNKEQIELQTSIMSEGFENNSNATFDPSYLTSDDSTFVIEPSKWGYTGSATTPASKPDYQGLSKDPSQNNIIENMQFAPECCPSAYSTSQGCACMSDDTIDFLASRGGNN